jgi:hypothetical protein
MKRSVAFAAVVGMALTLCWGISLLSPPPLQARSAVAVEGAKFDTSFSMADNLKMYMGKNVFVHLKSGITLQGYVKAVGNNLVHLEKLAGKDFYDALILIDEISAMEARFREMK